MLDTNVVSQFMRPQAVVAVVRWLASQPNETLFLSAVTIAEVRRGVLRLPHGRRRETFEDWFSGPAGVLDRFAGCILPFDEAAAMVWAELMSAGQISGVSRDPLDTIIAATAVSTGSVVVTLNQRHFAGVPTLNPAA